MVVGGVGLSKPVEACMTDLHDRWKKTADWAELHARHGQDVDKRFDEVIVLDPRRRRDRQAV